MARPDQRSFTGVNGGGMLGHWGGVKLYHLVRSCPAKKSELTGQQKCQIHIMENVTLTQKEQARLQVLNSDTPVAQHASAIDTRQLMEWWGRRATGMIMRAGLTTRPFL